MKNIAEGEKRKDRKGIVKGWILGDGSWSVPRGAIKNRERWIGTGAASVKDDTMRGSNETVIVKSQ